MDQKRLFSVTVNGEDAEAGDPDYTLIYDPEDSNEEHIAKYKAKVALDDDETTATVIITTREATDLI